MLSQMQTLPIVIPTPTATHAFPGPHDGICSGGSYSYGVGHASLSSKSNTLSMRYRPTHQEQKELVASTQCYSLSARIPRESGIDRRKIDQRVLFNSLGKQSKIDIPLDRDRRTHGSHGDPFLQLGRVPIQFNTAKIRQKPVFESIGKE